jgi:hypothetical protein
MCGSALGFWDLILTMTKRSGRPRGSVEKHTGTTMEATQADRRLAWATLIFFKPHGWARKASAALKCVAAVNGELILECGQNCITCIRLPRRKRSRHLCHLLFPSFVFSGCYVAEEDATKYGRNQECAPWREHKIEMKL